MGPDRLRSDPVPVSGAKARCKLGGEGGMPGVGLTASPPGQARADRLALEPYWGKPTVRNLRGGGGNVGIMRSPVRATALPDQFALARVAAVSLAARGTEERALRPAGGPA